MLRSSSSLRGSPRQTMVEEADAVLRVRDLRTYFFTRAGVGKAVDGISFDVRRGETFGLVGESGSGKSMTALSILRLHPRPASRIVGGQILLGDEDLTQLSEREMRHRRGKRLALILQDPQTALNPVIRIGDLLREPLRLHTQFRGASLKARAVELLRLLRVSDPATRLRNYAHELSGGMRQRAVGAIALTGEPELLIADEPTTALDVTVQAAYLELLRDVQQQTGLSIIFITHDLGVVARVCDRVAVMYGGKIVEVADTKALFAQPAHPYTEALLNSVPNVHEVADRLPSIEGQPPSIFEERSGCPFVARCPYAESRCSTEFPPEIEMGPGHLVSCWRFVGDA